MGGGGRWWWWEVKGRTRVREEEESGREDGRENLKIDLLPCHLPPLSVAAGSHDRRRTTSSHSGDVSHAATDSHG